MGQISKECGKKEKIEEDNVEQERGSAHHFWRS